MADNLIPDDDTARITQQTAAQVLGETVVTRMIGAYAKGLGRWLSENRGPGPWTIHADGTVTDPNTTEGTPS